MLNFSLPKSKSLSQFLYRSFSHSPFSSSNIYRPRRALLYMPGSNPKMLTKAPILGADSICMDLEDGVSGNQKQHSRQNIVNALQAWQQNHPKEIFSEKLVRINPCGSGFEKEDIDTILSGPVLPEGIVLPKVSHAEHVKWLHHEIEKKLKHRGDNNGKLVIIALIESARALLSLQSIAASSDLLTAFIFGADDYAADIGATRTHDNHEVLYARQHLVMVGKAYGLQCIDMVNIHYHNTEQMEKECEEGYKFGFTGKQIIHPKQIEIAHTHFAPHADKIAWATKIVEEHTKYAEIGVGAFSLDGAMIDSPTVKQAQNVLLRAKACGVHWFNKAR